MVQAITLCPKSYSNQIQIFSYKVVVYVNWLCMSSVSLCNYTDKVISVLLPHQAEIKFTVIQLQKLVIFIFFP